MLLPRNAGGRSAAVLAVACGRVSAFLGKSGHDCSCSCNRSPYPVRPRLRRSWASPTFRFSSPLPSFSDFSLLPSLKASLKEMDLHTPTDIQARAIPQLLKLRSLVAVAETRSGISKARGEKPWHRLFVWGQVQATQQGQTA